MRRTDSAGATDHILGMFAFASNSGTEVGVVSNGELDGDDNPPVMIKTVQVGSQWAANIIVIVGRRGSGTERAAGVIVAVGWRGSGTGIITRVTTRASAGRGE